MTLIDGILLGIVQGLTEFLPISSSGHLVIVQALIGIEKPGNEFAIIVHLGTLGSILIVFFKDIVDISTSINQKKTQKLLIFLFLGTLPAIIIGLGLKNQIESLFDNLTMVGAALVVSGIILLMSYFLSTSDRKYTIYKVLLIGMAQAFAIIPGISRSGMTICCGLMLGLRPEIAARFSFLLAIPVISGAGILTFMELDRTSHIDFSVAMAGLVTSFIVGLLSLRWLINLLKKGRLYSFGIYCLCIGVLTIILS